VATAAITVTVVVTMSRLDGDFTITPTIGWRAWLVDIDDPTAPELLSVTRSVSWPARKELVAVCEAGRLNDHVAGIDPRCSCGVYAAASLGDLRGARLRDAAALSRR
jgi:hypothetical protein